MNPHAKGERFLEARNVSKRFGFKTVLRDVNLSLHRGESLALFGPNGAGKSTLIHILCSLVRPSSGSLWIEGREVERDCRDLRGMIGFISHNTFLYPHLTAYENLRFYGRMYGTPLLDARIGEVLRLVEMEDYRDEALHAFSRGMQQRIAIARAVIHDPLLLFLDEPFTGLDQQGHEVLKELILSFRDQGKTVVMASHQLQLGIELCGRAVILKGGRVVYMYEKDPEGNSDFAQIYARHAGGSSLPPQGGQ